MHRPAARDRAPCFSSGGGRAPSLTWLLLLAEFQQEFCLRSKEKRKAFAPVSNCFTTCELQVNGKEMWPAKNRPALWAERIQEVVASHIVAPPTFFCKHGRENTNGSLQSLLFSQFQPQITMNCSGLLNNKSDHL